MENTLLLVQEYIEHYGTLGVFLASVIEELIPPIPSAVVQGFGGVLLMLGEPFSLLGFGKLLLTVSIPAAAGVCIGSLPYVFLARKYGIEIVEKYGKYFGASVNDLKRLENYLDNKNIDEIIFIGLRTLPAVPSIVLAIYSGTIGMSILKYNILSFIGVFIRATILGTAGWLTGKAFINNLTIIIGAIEKLVMIGIVFLIIYLFYKNYLRKNNNY